VLYHYADFAVSTIDSFCSELVTAFTRELGLPATFEVELDTDSVLQSAVAALLDKVNRDPPIAGCCRKRWRNTRWAKPKKAKAGAGCPRTGRLRQGAV
jgi:ATP-dependent exoDNAse (exonuclease V) beta subunit